MMHDRSYNSTWHFILFSGIFLAAFVISAVLSLSWALAIPFGVLLFYFGWQQWRLVFFLLIFSLPWSFEFSFSLSLGTDLPDEPLMLLTTALLLARLCFHSSEIAVYRKHTLIVLLWFCLAWIVVTVPFSTDWLISLKFLLAKTWYIAAFIVAPLLIFKTKKAISLTGLVLLGSMLGVVVIALMRHAAYGFSFASINKAVYPFFRNHVNYSAMLVCMIPVLIAAYRLTKRYRPVTVVGILIVLSALFFSYARGAWLALVIGLISYWLIAKQKLLASFIVCLFVVIGAAFWISRGDRYLNFANDYKTTIFHRDFREHLVATYKLKDLSTAERFNRWVAGIRMIGDNPVTGYGPNTFYSNYKPYSLPAFKTWVSNNPEHSTVHNYFLLILIEQGIPGLFFFVLLAGGILYYAERIYNRAKDQFYKTVAMTCGVMMMMILTVNFLSDLVETDKIGSLFFLCLGTLVVIDTNAEKLEVGRSPSEET